MVTLAAYAAGMTITDHLNFSVLSAPLETIDRRALSQAWYSALFDAHTPATIPHVSVKNTLVATHFKRPAKYSGPKQMRPCVQDRRSGKKCAASQSAAPLVERRRQTSSLAIKIDRMLRARRPNAGGMAFTIKDGGARVQLLLRGTGSRLTLVALCPAWAKAHVARALAHARYALSLRGVQLHVEAREQEC